MIKILFSTKDALQQINADKRRRVLWNVVRINFVTQVRLTLEGGGVGAEILTV